jgi:hypothetical protein
LALLLALVVIWLDRDMTPFHDEWWFLCGRSLDDPASLFLPHNEHWVTLHAVVYLGIAGIFGTTSSLPFLVVLLALHAAVAGAVWRLTGSLLAGCVMLSFGAGSENLLWPFQMGMVGALALSLWALVAFQEAHPRLGAALLVLAVTTQGNSLFVIPAIGAYLVASRRNRDVAWLCVPVLAGASWLFLERANIDYRGAVPTIDGAATFAVFGVVSALAFGAGFAVGAGHAALLAASMPGRLSPTAWAGLVGLAATFGALGLVREGFSPPDASRYLYIAAPFLILAIVEIARNARRPVLARSVLVSGFVIGVTLLVVNGLAWPADVARARAAGADAVPAAICPAGP